MDEKIIQRAVEAAAKAEYAENFPNGPGFYDDPDIFQAGFRDSVQHIVIAALAEVETSIKAEALRELVEHCFDENDATAVVGGINILLVYVCDTIAELTKEEKDFANAAQIRTYVSDQLDRWESE